MRFTIVLLFLLISVASFSQEKMRTDRVPEETRGRLVHRLKSLQKLKPNPLYNPPPSRTNSGLIIKKTYKENNTDFGTASGRDLTVQRKQGPPGQDESMRLGSVISSNKDGIAYTSVSPADPTIAVGPSHIIQMVNGEQGSFITVFDKAGNTLVGKQYMHDMLYTPGYFGYGDPVVLYDVFSNRYFISEFGSDSCANCFANSLVVGISTTADPTAGWNFYKFNPGKFFLDFPKYSAWPNALFATTNDYSINGSNYLGSSVYAMDKAAMVNGNPNATMQRIRLPGRTYSKFISMSPVSISGNTAPANPDAGIFVYFSDDNRTQATTDLDSLGVIRYKPDFSNSSNSTLTFEAPLLVAPFKSRVCNGSRNCIESGTGERYDDLSDRIMNKVYLRNFGTYESIVLNHTVDVNYPEVPALAGIRWYELQRSNGPWTVKQQGTYAPDNDGRFLGSMNINSKGQIGMVFNHSGSGKYASIYFTGRNATDEPGKMTYLELPVIIGDGYGTFSNRWGDYNELVLDPVDDSTFWLTAMYGSSNWKTRISSFRLEALPVNDVRILNIQSPLSGYASCNNSFSPVIVIRNNGIIEQDSIIIDTYIDNNLVASLEVNEPLLSNQNKTINLPPVISPKGKHSIRFSIRRALNLPDEDPTNDALALEYTIISPIDLAINEGFESETFVPFQWRVVNFNPNTATWVQTTTAGNESNSSVVNRLYENQLPGDSDLLITPPILVSPSDSLIFSFDRAYKVYGQSTSFADTLEILVTTDCGLSYQRAWKKGGQELASVYGTLGTGFVPNRSDWLREQIDLKQFTANANELSVAFKTISRFGQNIYLDNIRLTPINRRKIDLAVNENNSSIEINCSSSFNPVFTISNKGTDTIHSFTAYMMLNNAVTDSLKWTGLIAPLEKITQQLNAPLTIAAGEYVVRIYIADVNGSADQRSANDTSTYSLTVFSQPQLKLQEGFEKKYPPDNWHLSASSRGFSWEGSTETGKNSTGSVVIRNTMFNSNGLPEDLYTPSIKLNPVDSILLVFDHAYRKATRVSKEDTLEILLTKNCGNSLTSVYKKWGNDLNTIPSGNPDPTYPPGDTIGFVPLNTQWATTQVDLSKVVRPGEAFQLVFRNKSNEGSNLYLDNINVYGVILPRLLRQNGYQVYPNPFTGNITVRHYQRAAMLREVIISNTLGQRLFTRKFKGDAPDNFNINLSGYADGVYQIQLLYTDKKITERIIKMK